jgi:hypothetical protein
MGSGAFLVEACRQLAEALVRAWEAHGVRPEVPPDESDGTVWRVLERLLVLDGERLSYRTLDVEEIGSV